MFHRSTFPPGAVQLLVLALLTGLTGCTEGDSLFSDARSVHSGRYESDLATKQAAVEREHGHSAALSAEQKEMQSQSQLLDKEIARQKKRIDELNTKVARLDREAGQLRTPNPEAEKKRDDLQAQVSELKTEVASVQEQVASNPSADELAKLKRRQEELSSVYSDLLQIYKSM